MVLDAGVIIGALDSADVHHQASVATLASLQRDELILPASVLAEILVRPYGRGRRAVQGVEQFLADLGVRIHPLDVAVAHAAARLRSSHPPVRLPDALTLGTAAVVGGTVVTTDTGWPPDLGVPVRLVRG